MRARFGIIFSLLLLAIFGAGGDAKVQAVATQKVVIFDIPRLDLAEISPGYPHLYQMLNHNPTGLLSLTSPGPLTPDQVYLFFNTGVMAPVSPDGDEVYNAGETVHTFQPAESGELSTFNIGAGELYQSFTGRKIAPTCGVNVGIMQMLNGKDDLNNKNKNQNFDFSKVDFLGEILHRRSIKTAVIGNADTFEPHRKGALLAIDKQGIIDFGAVGPETLCQDPRVPYGVRTDSGRILQYYQSFGKKARFMVITLGDLERIESFQKYLSLARKAYYRRLALRRYDALLGRLDREIDPRTTLTVIFTCLPPKMPQLDKTGLIPVMIKGPGFHSGVLYSHTTRQPGIITCNDLRLTVIRFLSPCSMTRLQLSVKPGKWQGLAGRQKGLIQNYAARQPLLVTYGVLMIGLIVLMPLGMALRFSRKILYNLTLGYLFLLTLPAVFLMEAFFNPLDWFMIVGLALGMAGLVFGVSYYFSSRNPLGILEWIAWFTCGLVILDAFFNGHNELISFFGYSAIAGARFYGVGNEYLGVLLGSYITGMSLVLPKIRAGRRQILWAAVFGIGMVLFLPGFGSKIGGGLTALFGLGITTCLWLDQPIRGKEIGKLFAAACLGLALTWVWDFWIRPGGMSHFGQLLMEIRENGMGAFTSVAMRKLELNWNLIQSNPLSFVLIGILAVLPWWYRNPPAFFHQKIARFPEITSGFTGLCISALIALALNDTGIVAAATMFMYGIIMILPIMIDTADCPGGSNG